VAQVQATIENVPQNPGTAFTVSGNTITFDGAPASGTNNIYVYYTSPITQVIAPSQGTVFPSTLSTGGPSWDTSGNLGVGTTTPNKGGVSRAVTLNGTAGNIVEFCVDESRIGWVYGDNNLTALAAGGARRISLQTNGAERLLIDSAGRVTMPFQPMFSAFSNNTSPITTSATPRIMPYGNVTTNTGSFFSSNRFTAPIAGRYLFSFSALGLTGGGANLSLFKNGASLGGGGSNARAITTTNEANIAQSVIVTLAASDYVEVYYYNDGGGNSFFGAHGSFCGSLLG
jgi:hypothetical protein